MIRASVRLSVLVVLLLAQGLPVRAAEALDEVTRLAALGRVWGLLKYYNPRIAEGQIDWDATLVRFIPRVKRAQTKDELNRELLQLVRVADTRLRIPRGAPLDQKETVPALMWLDDARALHPVTIQILKSYRHSQAPSSNKYVKPAPVVNNPDFSGEAPMASPAFPQEEVRLLALFRYWNMVNYYSPNREITDRPWNDVLEMFVPRMTAATDAVQYHLALAELTVNLSDAHGIASSNVLSTYWGGNTAPIRVRYIESQTVITKVLARFAQGADVRVGDIVSDINGVSTATRRTDLAKYVAGSNPASLQRNLGAFILRTSAATMLLGIVRDGVRREVVLNCPPLLDAFTEDDATEDKTPSRVLPGNIGYLHMGWLEQQQVASVMPPLMNTRALIIDVRNYPQGTAGLVARYLLPGPREFALITEPKYDAPGTFNWRGTPPIGPPAPTTNFYRGQVILLFDERAQSQSEFTLMGLRTAPDVTLVGSQTAGADGNISLIVLPGGFQTYISGIGVYYPDRTPTQRVGIVPDHYVTPTIAGIRAGVDEVLEYALRLVR